MAETETPAKTDAPKEKKLTSYDVLVPVTVNLTDQAGLKALAEKYGAEFNVLLHAGTADGQNPKQALSEYAGSVDGDASGAYKVVASASLNDFPNVRFETAKPKLVIG